MILHDQLYCFMDVRAFGWSIEDHYNLTEEGNDIADFDTKRIALTLWMDGIVITGLSVIRSFVGDRRLLRHLGPTIHH